MRHWITCVLLLLGWVGAAHAAVLLDQPLNVNGDGRASYLGGSTNFITYDRLVLPQAATVNRVTWIGGFFDAATDANNPIQTLHATAWQFRVAGDAGNDPGAGLPRTTATQPGCNGLMFSGIVASAGVA